MVSVVAILLLTCAGLFVGSRVNSAREARAHFTSYRHRTTAGLTAWVRNVVAAALGIAGLLLVLYILLLQVPTR